MDLLLLTRDERRRQAWSAAIQGIDLRVFESPAQLNSQSTLGIVVTDEPHYKEQLAAWAEQFQRGEIVSIGIGEAIPAEVSLPYDFAPRELQNACRLAAEIVLLRRQLQENRAARKELAQLAMTDPLTTLPNRRTWDQELAYRGEISAAEGRSLCLAIFDIDHFKTVNQRQGHAAGDKILQSLGQSLTDCVRSDDMVARLGGDEFALLAWDLQEKTAYQVVERIRRSACEKMASGDSTSPLQTTLSAGWATSADGETPALFQRADAALRQAKTVGRDQTVPAIVEEDA